MKKQMHLNVTNTQPGLRGEGRLLTAPVLARKHLEENFPQSSNKREKKSVWEKESSSQQEDFIFERPNRKKGLVFETAMAHLQVTNMSSPKALWHNYATVALSVSDRRKKRKR